MNSDMDYRILYVHKDVNACDCTPGCKDTVTESALKLILGENPLPLWGLEPASTVCSSDALPTELHPHPQLESLLGVPLKAFLLSKQLDGRLLANDFHAQILKFSSNSKHDSQICISQAVTIICIIFKGWNAIFTDWNSFRGNSLSGT